MSKAIIGFLAGVVAAALAGFLAFGGPDGHADRPHAATAAPLEGHGHDDDHDHDHDAEGVLRLTERQIADSGIALVDAAAGALVRTVAFPATATTVPDSTAVAAAKAAGVLVEVRTRLGATVARGDVLAVLDSREAAEARSELVAAQRAETLARATLERERALWTKKVSAEQDYLQARAAADAAGMRTALARQKLATLGLDPAAPSDGSLGRYAVRAPAAGRVVALNATIGAAAAADAALFTVADLTRLWFEAAAPPGDLALLRQGAAATIDGRDRPSVAGAVVFVGPMIDRDTRQAQFIVDADNADGAWRPGDYATVTVERAREAAAVVVPAAAIQHIKDQPVVFVRSADGFEKRDVVLGRADAQSVEIRFGVDAGETVAAANSFVLKAELEKAEAEHVH